MKNYFLILFFIIITLPCLGMNRKELNFWKELTHKTITHKICADIFPKDSIADTAAITKYLVVKKTIKSNIKNLQYEHDQLAHIMDTICKKMFVSKHQRSFDLHTDSLKYKRYMQVDETFKNAGVVHNDVNGNLRWSPLIFDID
jgi:hypothetical protein